MVKITDKVIEDVITQLAGFDVVPLFHAMKGKENVSEFTLAKDINQEINITRNYLYRLYEHNLVSFTRKKDKQKGWYIYYWTFNKSNVPYLMWTLKEKRLERLKERLDREENGHFYMCPEKCMRLDFEQAMNFNFKCPECEEIIQQEDNRSMIKNIKDEISTLESELKEKEKSMIQAAAKIAKERNKEEERLQKEEEKKKAKEEKEAKKKAKELKKKKDAAKKKEAKKAKKKKAATKKKKAPAKKKKPATKKKVAKKPATKKKPAAKKKTVAKKKKTAKKVTKKPPKKKAVKKVTKKKTATKKTSKPINKKATKKTTSKKSNKKKPVKKKSSKKKGKKR